MRPAVRRRRHRGAPRGRPAASRWRRPARRRSSTPFAERLGMDAVIATRVGDAATASTPAQLDGPVVWGRGKLEAVRDVGRGRAGRPAQLVRLQRQLLRRPAARRRRHPGRGQPRPPPRRRWPGCAGWPIRHLDLPEGVPKIAGRELQAWTRFLQRPELLPNVRLDIEGVETDPPRGRGDRGVQPPQLLRRHGRRRRARPDRALVPLPREEGGVRRAGRRRVRPDGRRHPGQPVVGLRRAAGGGDQGAAAPARRSPSPRRARSRAGRRSSPPSSRAGGARPAWPRRPRAPGRSRSGCGAPRRCGRATPACPG